MNFPDALELAELWSKKDQKEIFVLVKFGNATCCTEMEIDCGCFKDYDIAAAYKNGNRSQ